MYKNIIQLKISLLYVFRYKKTNLLIKKSNSVPSETGHDLVLKFLPIFIALRQISSIANNRNFNQIEVIPFLNFLWFCHKSG